MGRALRWLLTGFGIALASVTVFILAAGLFPGDPGRFYMVVAVVLLTATLLVRFYEAAASSANGAAALEVRNGASEALDVWIEPWCHPYRVPPGSTLSLHYAARGSLLTEATADGLVIWLNSRREPRARLDGNELSPDS